MVLLFMNRNKKSGIASPLLLAIANVREIFDAAAKMKNADSTPLLSHDIQQRAAAYLEEYGA